MGGGRVYAWENFAWMGWMVADFFHFLWVPEMFPFAIRAAIPALFPFRLLHSHFHFLPSTHDSVHEDEHRAVAASHGLRFLELLDCHKA